MENELLENLGRLHTTELGVIRMLSSKLNTASSVTLKQVFYSA